MRVVWFLVIVLLVALLHRGALTNTTIHSLGPYPAKGGGTVTYEYTHDNYPWPIGHYHIAVVRRTDEGTFYHCSYVFSSRAWEILDNGNDNGLRSTIVL